MYDCIYCIIYYYHILHIQQEKYQTDADVNLSFIASPPYFFFKVVVTDEQGENGINEGDEGVASGEGAFLFVI